MKQRSVGTFALFVCAFSLCPALPADTLKEVLERNNIPTKAFSQQQLNANVSSGEVETFGDITVLAYPSLTADEEGIVGPIHVMEFNHASGKVTYGSLASPQVSDECFGAVLNLRTHGNRFLIETHINPSASCTLVIDLDLALQYTLMGFLGAPTDPDHALFQEDVVHFAALHPLRMHLVDIPSGTDVRIYPPDGDPARKRFSEQLEKHLPSETWCGHNNNPCDPSQFDESIMAGPNSAAGGSIFAFTVSYDSSPFGKDAEAIVGQDEVLYVYRQTAGQWSYCDREIAESESDTIHSRIQIDLVNLVKTCPEKRKLSVTATDSPFARFEIKAGMAH